MTSGRFNRFATLIARKTGHSSAFGLAVIVIVGWAVTGPLFDSAATQMKLDEIIRATIGAHNVLLDLEDRSDDELSLLRNHYGDLARQARSDVRSGLQDTGAGADRE